MSFTLDLAPSVKDTPNRPKGIVAEGIGDVATDLAQGDKEHTTPTNRPLDPSSEHAIDIDEIFAEADAEGEVNSVEDEPWEDLYAAAREIAENLEQKVASGANPTELAQELVDSGMSSVVVENLSKFIGCGARIDLNNLVAKFCESDQSLFINEDLEEITKAGVSIDFILDRIVESEYGGAAIFINLDKFVSCGATYQTILDKISDAGEQYRIVKHLPTFTNAGVKVDANELAEEFFKNPYLALGDDYNLYIANLLNAGANVNALARSLAQSSLSYHLGDSMEILFDHGADVLAMAESLLVGNHGSYQLNQNMPALLAHGLNMNQLTQNLIDKNQADIIAKYPKVFLGSIDDKEGVVSKLMDHQQWQNILHNLNELIEVGVSADWFIDELIKRGQLEFLQSDLGKLIRASQDPSAFLDKVINIKGLEFPVSQMLSTFIEAGVPLEYAIEQFNQVGLTYELAYDLPYLVRMGADVEELINAIIFNEINTSVPFHVLISNLSFIHQQAPSMNMQHFMQELVDLGAGNDDLLCFLEVGVDPIAVAESLFNNVSYVSNSSLEALLVHSKNPNLIADMYIKALTSTNPIESTLSLLTKYGADINKIVTTMVSQDVQFLVSNFDHLLECHVDPTYLADKLLESGQWTVVLNRLEKLLDLGAKVDPTAYSNTLMKESPTLLLSYLELFIKVGVKVDIDNLLSEVGSDPRAIAPKLRVLVENGAKIDLPNILSYLSSNNQIFAIESHIDIFIRANISPIELRIALGEDNLRDKKEGELDDLLSKDPDFRRFMSSLSGTKEVLSAQLYKEVYQKVSAGTRPAEVEFLKMIGLTLEDGTSPVDAYVACTRQLSKITAQVISGTMDKDILEIFSKPTTDENLINLSNMLIQRLRLKRGSWSMNITPEQFINIIQQDAEAAQEGKVWAEVEEISVEEFDPEWKPLELEFSKEARDQADFILEALANAAKVKNNPVEFMKLINIPIQTTIGELKGKKRSLEENSKIPENKKLEQLASIDLILSKLIDEKGNQVEVGFDNVAELIQVVTGCKFSDKEVETEVKLNLLGFLALPILNGAALEVPDHIDYMMTMIRNPEVVKLSTQDIMDIGEFTNHVLGKEFWSKIVSFKEPEIKRAMSQLLGASSIQSDIRQFDKVLLKAQAASVESKTREVKVLRTNSLLARSTAGAMGDACYSRVNSIVPEDAETCILLGEDDEILGSYLVLKGLDEAGQPIDMIRALNPLESTLKKLKVSSIVQGVLNLVREKASQTGRIPAIVVDDNSNAATTNRSSVLSQVTHFKKPPNKIATKDVKLVFNNYHNTVDRVYRI